MINSTQIALIKSRVQLVLDARFDISPKRKIHEHRDRLTFACPYCGDSNDDVHKKRGNLFFKNLMYHCFNAGCYRHTNLVELLKDYNQSISNLNDLNSFLDYINENKYDKYVVSQVEESEIFGKFKMYGIPREVIKKKLNLKEISECVKMQNYLKGRLLGNRFSEFMSNQDEDVLYIFNYLTKDTVIGWQVRNFNELKNKNKYQSFSIEKINDIVLKKPIMEDNEIVMKMNTFSIYFGIMQADFSTELTVLEGPIDAMFIKNSIATCGIDKSIEIFEDMENVRYLLDNDKVGIKKTIELLKERKKVFMWKKLIKDFSINESIKDVNDLTKYCWFNKSDAIKHINEYFTNNPLDILYV